MWGKSVSIPSVHPAQILSRSGCSITTDIMYKDIKIGLKNRSLVLTIQTESDFS